jgi:chromosome segregation ATPase
LFKTTLGGKNAQLINHAEDLERTVAVQRNEIEQLRDQIGQLQSFNAAIEQKNAGLFSETQDLGFQRDETARRLDEAEAHAHDQKVLLEQKDQTIHDLGDRLAQLASEQERSAAEATQVIRHLAEEVRLQRDETLRRLADVEKSVREQLAADHAVVASQSAETSQQLSREIQSQREEIVRGLAEVETRIRDRDAVLKRKDQETQKLAERLADLASEQGISANRAAETLQQLSGEIQLHRHQTMRGLVEAESRLKDRDVALEQRDLLIHALEECVARLTSEQSAIINRTTEALQRFSEEIQFQREESTAEIERYRSLASGSEERTQALLAQVAQVNDAARQKEMGVRQMESTLRQEISELQELRHRNEAAIGGLEKRVRLLEQENHQLKFD